MASAGEFDSDEFSTNLFSDLAPLLLLFGEEITTQFLSMSLGWADNFLLAMGPVGIITIVLSAIRIGGSRTLKSVVGRARETQAVAEQELLSSTSSNVCEVWNGQQIVRLVGESMEMVVPLVVARDGTVFTLPDSFQEGLITTNKKNRDPVIGVPNIDALDYNIEALSLPPNLTLNTRSAPPTQLEMWLWAGIGAVLQALAIVYPVLATYDLQWDKGGFSIAEYGYPCFAVGSVCLTVGVMLCGHIIEGATEEAEFVLAKDARRLGMKILCLQESYIISDHNIPSCAIFLAEGDGILRTSRRGYLKHGHAEYDSFHRFGIG
ncbi:unnamed protein product [Colletotrichum noveboracense]|uniref:Uncharacterized protein n=1 Tax=Colletotrichum noveboracense TaxID=2664923 RepID=A0A9W4S3Q8_9PEZI|nr:unnamed protein product [Colletotrichum noveboracense]